MRRVCWRLVLAVLVGLAPVGCGGIVDATHHDGSDDGVAGGAEGDGSAGGPGGGMYDGIAAGGSGGAAAVVTGGAPSAVPVIECELPMEFADPILEEAVLGHMSSFGVSPEDPSALETLGASDGITDLSGIECLTGLRSLFLTENSISDLGPLAGLTSLESLYLDFNEISDLTPLARLTELREVQLQYNSISDLGPLSGWIALESIWLMGNDITDLGPLVDNPGLSDSDIVWAGENPIDCLDQAENLAALRRRGVRVYVDC